MINIERFAFNPFQVNTYIVWDETKECIIIDPGMQGPAEEQMLVDFIQKNQLVPVMLLLTHAHVDHIAGCSFTAERFDIKMHAHKDSAPFLKNAQSHAAVFGLALGDVKEIDEFVDEKDEITFGNSKLKVLFTPGHANGSLCFYAPEEKFVITGDVLFNQSIGRTDLPTGNYDVLQQSIWEKLFTLPDETTAYPGHGPETTIGAEKVGNPFVAIGK